MTICLSDKYALRLLEILHKQRRDPDTGFIAVPQYGALIQRM